MAQFNSYADVQAALDREHQSWLAGVQPGRTAEGQAARDWWNNRGGGGAPAPAPAPPPPPPPPPGQKQTSQVKVANVNVININYAATPVEQMEKMFFQDVGGTEILSVTRHDTVGGEKVIYSEVDNLQDLKIQFNPLNILVSTNLNDLFSGYGIDIKEKVNDAGQTVQIDASGNMVIEVVGVAEDEYVQIQVASRVEDFEVGD